MKQREFLKEARAMAAADISAKVRANSEEQMKLRFRKASGQLQDATRIKHLRRDRARLLTVKREQSSSKAK